MRIETIKQRYKYTTQYPAVLSIKHTHIHTHKRRGWREEERQGPTSHGVVRYVSLYRDSGGVGECLLVSGGPQAEGSQAKGPERETGLYSGRSVRLGCSEQVGRREKFLSVSEVTDMASIQSP